MELASNSSCPAKPVPREWPTVGSRRRGSVRRVSISSSSVMTTEAFCVLTASFSVRGPLPEYR